MRNLEEKERMKKYPKTTIRVRFPDGLILQINFLSSEKGTSNSNIGSCRGTHSCIHHTAPQLARYTV
jgi:hypothetical protein